MAKGDFSKSILGATTTRPDSKKDANLTHGIYLAKVVNNTDDFLTGSIEVEIPALYRSTGQGVKSIKKVQFSTPFGGISPNVVVKPEDTEKYENTQQSYGMWFQPPDVGSMVLVAFADGNMKHGYVISHVLKPEFNHMVPGLPGGKSFQGGDFNLPTAEKNQYSGQEGHIDVLRPIHHDISEAITRQGLANDPIRGPGTQGARRDTPSNVLGILSKGPRHKKGLPSGAGHSFVMDDDPVSSMVRLRSGKGQQILLDDVTGTIYMINKDGRCWMELDCNGNINFFGDGDINFRAKKNFNLRADYDINIEAGQNIRIKAAGDNIDGEMKETKLAKLGLPTEGTGGNINFHAAADMGMLATRNAQLSAIGGDVDINAGSMIKTESGLGTAISANLMGVNITAKAGTIGIDSPLSVGIKGGTDVGIAGAMIRLNTPVGEEIAAKIKGVAFDALKVTAPAIEGNEQEDQSSEFPEYDREGQVALTSGGKRPGERPKIKTIVQTLVTAEPYAGHAPYNPQTEDPESISEDMNADAETMEGQISPEDNSPADTVTPEGDKKGNGFKDAKSGVVKGANAISGAIGGVSDKVGGTGTAISGAIDKVTGMVPNMEGIKDKLSNFLPSSLQSLTSIKNLDGLVAAMGIAIPAFRIPTGNALGDKIVGIKKQLKEMEARLGQFSLDGFDLPLDLNLEKVKEMKNKITGVVDEVNALKSKADELSGKIQGLKTDAQRLAGQADGFASSIDPVTGEAHGSMGITSQNFVEVKSKLSEKGIDTTVDGPSLIFTDRKSGTKIVDISNGIGPVGQRLGLMSTLQSTKKQIAELITVDISENQTLALTSFVSHIGIRNFARSECLIQLNSGNYDQVPKCMKRWRTGRIGADSDIVVRPDYVQRREYECELFTTPDWLNLTLEEMGLAGPNKNLSFGQLRSQLKLAKERKYKEMGITE